jgi:hypothetical protein
MSNEATNKKATTETAPPSCAPSTCSADLTLAQAKHFEWLWHGTTERARRAVPPAIIKQIEAVLGHELTIS